QLSKILICERHDLRRIDITSDRDHHICRNVMCMKEVQGIRGRESRQVRVPSDRGTVIRKGHEGSFQELLNKTTDRLTVGAHPPLFDNYIALFIELAHDRVQKAL